MSGCGMVGQVSVSVCGVVLIVILWGRVRRCSVWWGDCSLSGCACA